ncbi:MAG: DNA-3-methyladenine glycosylase I [Coprobacillaceae bacterium]
MEKKRCSWAENASDLDVQYHDEEWGVPVHDDQVLFEFIVLEGMQAGLSWSTILQRRETMREAFDNYDLQKIINYDQSKIDSLLQNPGIIRNKLKVNAVIINAKLFLDIQKEFGSFDTYLWNFVDNKPVINHWKSKEDVPVSTPLSDAISKDLKKRGFKFVGTTIMYAYLQATGVVNDHQVSCFCYRKD